MRMINSVEIKLQDKSGQKTFQVSKATVLKSKV